MKMQINKMTIVLLSTLALGACSNQNVKQNDGGEKIVAGGGMKPGSNNEGSSGTIKSGGASGVNSRSTAGQNGNRANFNYLPGNRVNNDPNNTSDISLSGLNDPNNLLSQRVIYFDYDKAAIRPEYMILINTHARLAAKFPNLKMRLEGHADERGSREYNVALSEQRAQSVRRIMGTQGARSSQIKTIGYGEEVPVVTGHSKSSWKKNRRVEIKYDNY